MKALEFEEAMGQIDDKIILEVVSTMNNENKIRQKKKVFRTILIAAVIASMMITVAYASGRLLNSPQQAWKAAQQEVARWKELGLLTDQVEIADQANMIIERPQEAGDDYWYGRLFPHRYAIDSISGQYHINMDVDTFDGKITRFSLEAAAQAGDAPARTETGPEGSVYTYYDNYDDIIPPEMTVDRFCTGLAEYWGFTGYTLADTQDNIYGYNSAAPTGDTLLTELSEGAYLIVYFDGDQSGVPMYVELAQFPGSVYLTAGTNHLVG